MLLCWCSCSEAVVMLANIRQHAAYIASTIGYIDDQIAADTRIVTDASVSSCTSLPTGAMLTISTASAVVGALCAIGASTDSDVNILMPNIQKLESILSKLMPS